MSSNLDSINEKLSKKFNFLEENLKNFPSDTNKNFLLFTNNVNESMDKELQKINHITTKFEKQFNEIVGNQTQKVITF